MSKKMISRAKFLSLVGGKTIENVIIANEMFIAFDAKYGSFKNCTFQDCKFATCMMDRTLFEDCSFYGCDMSQVSMKEAIFKNCTFSTRMDLCSFTNTKFVGCNFKNGYIRNSVMDLVHFTNTTFDGIWAGNITVDKIPEVFGCSYTMGGATSNEVENAKCSFFIELGIIDVISNSTEKAAIHLINDYSKDTFEKQADFSNIRIVSLGFSSTGEGVPITVCADLVDYRINFYFSDVVTECSIPDRSDNYNSLDDLIEKELTNLQFEELIGRYEDVADQSVLQQ